VRSEPGAPRARALVVDANILIRAALGRRVLPLLETYAESVDFLAAEVAFADAQVHVPHILVSRGLPPEAVARLTEQLFSRLAELVTPEPDAPYAHREAEARQRLSRRDESDWPFIALALTLNCPIWTEDQDFFGCGVPTWTTDRVEIYLAAES
jgi:predicted nucleic acid-binding protein